MTNEQISNTANAIVNDYRATKKRISQLCRVLDSLAKGAYDAGTINRAGQLSGRLNSACQVVRPEIVIPTDPKELAELRRQLMLAAL